MNKQQKQKNITIAGGNGKGATTMSEKEFAKKYKRIKDPKINEDGSCSLTLVDFYGNEQHFCFKTIEECNKKMGFGKPNMSILMRNKP